MAVHFCCCMHMHQVGLASLGVPVEMCCNARLNGCLEELLNHKLSLYVRRILPHEIFLQHFRLGFREYAFRICVLGRGLYSNDFQGQRNC